MTRECPLQMPRELGVHVARAGVGPRCARRFAVTRCHWTAKQGQQSAARSVLRATQLGMRQSRDEGAARPRPQSRQGALRTVQAVPRQSRLIVGLSSSACVPVHAPGAVWWTKRAHAKRLRAPGVLSSHHRANHGVVHHARRGSGSSCCCLRADASTRSKAQLPLCPRWLPLCGPT